MISFDTETRSRMEGDKELMTLRLWSAAFCDRRAPKRRQPIDETDDGVFADDLVFTVHRWAKMRRTVWAYAHNLGFDLCTSDLVPGLVRLGWEVTDFAVNSGSPFVRMHHKDSSLTLVDSWSWFGVRLEDVADTIGLKKPPLPKDTDTDDDWRNRCRMDVQILHTAILALMEWWDINELGNWSITGGASGWNAMRHIPSPQDILIRPDNDECDHDRRAIYGGRRTCWISGHSRYGHFSEVDIYKAYTSVCRYMPLPSGRQCRFDSLPTDHRWIHNDRFGVIAECDIQTDDARFPVRMANSVWYPVGTFRTTLASPDITEAREIGALLRVGAGWLHRLSYSLRPWATWCISALSDDTGTTPEVAKLVHKLWARSAIGKWAQRGFEVVPLGPSPNSGWHHEEAWHHGKNVPASIVDFAGQRYQVAAVNSSDNAYPAILAFVESHVRVALGKAMHVVGSDHMVSCDTDGYICDSGGLDRIGDANEVIAPLRLRVKHHYSRVRVIGPQHLELGNERRRAGIPGSATLGRDGKLHAQTWPKLAWQLTYGRAGTYIRPSQTYQLAATYAPGWVLSDGSVVPIELGMHADGTNYIVPFNQSRYGKSGLTLGQHQNRRLEAYRDG